MRYNSGKTKLMGFIDWLGGRLIRITILAVALLTGIQLITGIASDPVDFYLTIARQIESPPLYLQEYSDSANVLTNPIPENLPKYRISLTAIPAAPIKVMQKGRILGLLTKGKLEFYAEEGQVQFDGRNVAQIVRIRVENIDNNLKEPKLNQTFIIERNVASISIQQ